MGGFEGDVAAGGTHGDPDRSCGESGHVVDAVTHHANVPASDELCDELGLGVGFEVGVHLVEADGACDRGAGAGVTTLTSATATEDQAIRSCLESP